jgi:hypothetical protein
MRRVLALMLALALVPAPSLAEPASLPDLRIVELLPEPDTALGQREFVEIWNAGNASVELAGWKIGDSGTSTFVFPAWTLAPGRRVVVWGGGPADAAGPAWPDATVWNNAGDAAYLRAPDGTLVDSLGFGTAPAPAEPKPPKGQSLQEEAGVWRAGTPTPGVAPGAVAGTITLAIANAPPTLGWTRLPVSARHGALVEVAFTVGDPNGDADVAAWSLHAAGVQVAHGTAAGSQAASFAAPAVGAALDLLLTARDGLGSNATLAARLDLRDSDLGVTFPDGPVRFEAVPGAAQALAVGRLRLDNAGASPVVPLLDVSQFRATAAAFDPEGRLLLGWDDAWHPYTGPLTPLAAIPPGGVLDLRLRLDGVPSQLPVGSYGASFTVVPA